MKSNEPIGKAKGGIARAAALSAEQKREIAKKGAIARWGYKAIRRGNFKDNFGVDAECYVLDDTNKTPVISQRGMAKILGFSVGGDRLVKFIAGKKMSQYAGVELQQIIQKPIIFQWGVAGAKQQPPTNIHGNEASILIDICKAIIDAEMAGALTSVTHKRIAKQAHIVLGASAKSGIQGLVYALAGYRPSEAEVIEAFKAYVQQEAKKYEKEFPNELYVEWQRLYNIKPPQRGKNWKEMHLTIDHIYSPLAKSNGKLLELLRSAKTAVGDRNIKLFSFLNAVGARALRMQLGRVLEMAESSLDRKAYEAKIIERFGGQMTLKLPTYPIS